MPAKSRSRKQLEQSSGGYNYEAAIAAGAKPDPVTKHWQSRVPDGPNEGMILKSPRHESIIHTYAGEADAGTKMTQRGDTLFSYEKDDPRLQMGPRSQVPYPSVAPKRKAR